MARERVEALRYEFMDWGIAEIAVGLVAVDSLLRSTELDNIHLGELDEL